MVSFQDTLWKVDPSPLFGFNSIVEDPVRDPGFFPRLAGAVLGWLYKPLFVSVEPLPPLGKKV